ncbi:MAG: putative toxin-antitoxin system toxin component, PIN family [Gemmatimonadota bacterium]|nr:putative toxin-antitoxin system toxin component, PIN family [Gemmatimonadota bacterium]
MRVFLDTNVLVSAFGTRGLCSDVFHVVLAEHQLVLGTTVLDELPHVLTRKFRAAESLAREATDFLRQQAHVVEASTDVGFEIRDPDDVPVVGEALAGQVDVLVTGDADILDVADTAPIRILSPRAFWESLRTEGR